MSKKAKAVTGTGAAKRYLNDDQCLQVAGRISDQLRRYPELKSAWDRGTCGACVAEVVPIWGPDLETVTIKVNRLFHPAEAAVIIPALTA